MNILHQDICPLCGKSHLKKTMTCVDHYATGESFDLVRCENCGFLLTQNPPVEAEIGRYYESPDYISHTDTHKGLMNQVYHWVRKYMLGRKARLVRQHSGMKEGHILDIGTGTGYFSHAMKERGWDVSAIEKSPQAREFAKKHFDLEVDAPEALGKYAKNSFDVVTLWHVMEHLEHLNETWDTLSNILKDSGTLIVAVPNPTSFDAKKYGEMWAAYDTPRHLWHFSPSVMQQFGTKHGFTLEERLPMPFDAFYVSMLTEKYKKHSFSFLRGMWTGMQALMASMIKKDQSSSIIYIFRKKV